MKVLCIFVGMVVATKADYHQRVGIPLGKKIKAYEDELFANPAMESRVAKSNPAGRTGHPFVASLLIPIDWKTSICGASIVRINRLVTAAHCLFGIGTIVDARVGSQYLFYGGTVIRSASFMTYPDFKPNDTGNHDVGIIRLPTPLELSDLVQLIEMPWLDINEQIGEWAITLGWGVTSDNDRSTPVAMELREAALQLTNETECENYYNATMHGNIVCTSGAGGRGTCDGDSGGPLYIVRDGKKILAGITGFGDKQCEKSSPSVFARVKTYMIFIYYADDSNFDKKKG